MKLRLWKPDGGCEELVAVRSRVRLGRNADCEVALNSTEYPMVSGCHAELVRKDGAVWLLHRSKSNATVYAGSAIEKPQRLKAGDRFRLGFTGPEIELLDDAIQGTEPGATIMSGKASDFLPPSPTGSVQFRLGSGGVIGRDADASTFHLEHPHVSRRHARVKVVSQKTLIGDLRSSNGTYVNGERITRPVELTRGDVVDIGPFSLTFDGTTLAGGSRKNNVRLDVEHVSFVVPDPRGRRSLHLLTDVSFTADPGEFIGILGPSGSGKSTLLKIISGRNWPFSGQVTVNGRDLHREFAALKQDLVVVPQTSAVHEELTVEQTLRYTAMLRLPADTETSEVDGRVISVLTRVGLANRSATQVRMLSGGQLKRLGLACELISDPSLVFLDEVTSGLDELSDKELMSLLRELSDSGKTLVCITHNISNVQAMCHKVLVLTHGGRTAFFGTPADACSHFGVSRLADVYGVLETRTAEQWNAAWLHGQHDPIVAEAADSDERIASRQLAGVEQSRLVSVAQRLVSQAVVLVRRCAAIWRADVQALAALFGQALLVTALLCLVFGELPPAGTEGVNSVRASELRNLLFLIGVSCFWLGANNAAKEIVKERRIFNRERDFNLIPESYALSKLAVLELIGFAQAALVSIACVMWCDVPGERLQIAGAAVILNLLGTCLGLALSAWSRSEEVAAALVPTTIIPQIVLAGVVAELTGTALGLAKLFVTVFWGQKLLEHALPKAERLPSAFEPDAATCIVVLAVHGACFAGLTWGGLRFLFRDRR